MGTLIGLLVSKGMSEKWARVLLTAGLFVVLLGACAGIVFYLEHKGATKYVQKVEQRAAPATDQAATERANDTVVITQHEQEAHNAIAAQPDQPIAPTSHVRACEQLRRAGRHPAACR